MPKRFSQESLLQPLQNCTCAIFYFLVPEERFCQYFQIINTLITPEQWPGVESVSDQQETLGSVQILSDSAQKA